jgi:hypothetical protein
MDSWEIGQKRHMEAYKLVQHEEREARLDVEERRNEVARLMSEKKRRGRYETQPELKRVQKKQKRRHFDGDDLPRGQSGKRSTTAAQAAMVQQEAPLPANSGENFKTVLSNMGTPRLTPGNSRTKR